MSLDEFGVADVDSKVHSLSHERLQGLKKCFEEKLKSKNTSPGVLTSSAESLINTMSEYRDSLNFEFVKLVVRYLKDEDLQKRMDLYEKKVRKGTEKLLTECRVNKITPIASPECTSLKIHVDPRSYSLYEVLEVRDFLVRRIGVSVALFAGWSEGRILHFNIVAENSDATVLKLKDEPLLRNYQVERIEMDCNFVYPPEVSEKLYTK